MNTLKNIDHERQLRRLKAKLELKRKNSRRVPKLVATARDGLRQDGKKVKPDQRTIVRMVTARSMFYLERRGLATFKNCHITIAMKKFWRTNLLGQSEEIDLAGVPSFGV